LIAHRLTFMRISKAEGRKTSSDD